MRTKKQGRKEYHSEKEQQDKENNVGKKKGARTNKKEQRTYVLRISSGVLPLIMLATVLQVRSKSGLISR
jgi:hypothetical protein